MICAAIASDIKLDEGILEGAPCIHRYLSDLSGVFADAPAYRQACAQGNPLLYTVSTLEPASGDGQLHYGLGRLMPGKIGREYFLTKGHFHAWRGAAEVYVGLRGAGWLLLEAEKVGESCLLPLGRDQVVYVPGYTAHRTINTGQEPLVYLGIYPAAAGHDYEEIAARNFRQIVVEENGRPKLLNRSEYQP